MPQDEWKTNAALLAALCEQLPGEWSIDNLPKPPAPDGILVGPSGRVAVELTQYRAQTEDNERYEREDGFAIAFQKAGIEDPSSYEFSLFLVYKTDSRGRKTVPGAPDHALVIRNLMELCATYGRATEGRSSVEVYLGAEFEEGLEMPGAQAQRCIASSRWPLLRTFLKSVVVRHHPSLPTYTFSSSLGSAFIGVDREQIRRVVNSKLEKLRGYREALPEVPVWLVVHNDGWPLSTILIHEQVEAATSIARETLHRGDDRFDAAFWLVDARTPHPSLRPLDDTAEHLLKT